MMEILSTQPELAHYDTTTTLLGIATAFTLWTVLYFILCVVNSKSSYEWNCRVVTTVHAVTVVTMSGYSGFIQGPWSFSNPGSPNTKLQHWTSVTCLGFFIYDLLWCLYFQTEGLVMCMHHCVTIFGQSCVLYLGTDGVENMAATFLSEITNPFLQLRWFLRYLDKHRTWYGEVNDHVFMLLFGICRIGFGDYLLYIILTSPVPCLGVKLGTLAILCINWIFWILILRYAFRKYKKKWAVKEHKEVNGNNNKNKSSSGHSKLE